MRTLLHALIIMTLVWSSGQIAAQSDSETGSIIDAVFDEVERAVIEEYYKKHHGPGPEEESANSKKGEKGKNKTKKAKSKGLPPGLPRKTSSRRAWPSSWNETAHYPPGLPNGIYLKTYSHDFPRASLVIYE